MGRTYVFACLLGGLAGTTIALCSASGLVAGLGFFLLAIAWFYCTLRAWRAALAHDYIQHQRWMIRSFSLTFAAVMLRVYTPLALTMGSPSRRPIRSSSGWPGCRTCSWLSGW